MHKLTALIQSLEIKQRFLLVGLFCAYIPHTLSQPAVVVLFCTCLLAWYVLYSVHVIGLPNKWLAGVVTIFVVGYIAYLEPVFLGRNMGVAILMIALCLKLLENKKSTDMLSSIGLAYFVAISALLFSHSMVVGFSVICAIYLFTMALCLHYSPTNTFARVMASTHRLMLQAMPLTVVLLLLMPQTSGPLWQLPMDARAGGLGMSNKMALGEILQLAKNDDVAFRVKFKTPPNNIDPFYWRAAVFPHYDGQSWQPGYQSPFDGENPPASKNQSSKNQSSKDLAVTHRADYSGETVKYTVTLEPHNYRWLLTLDQPTTLDIDAIQSLDDEHLARQVISKPISYAAVSRDFVVDVKQTRLDWPPTLWQRYLQLPNAYAYKTRQLAKKLKRQAGISRDADQQIVRLALNYFAKNPFYYSKKPPTIKYDPVDEFMFKTRKGYCEHYASAFTFLMRAAGVPARVVTGYYGGEYNSAGDYYVIRQSDAHAWSEVWFENKGWTRVDPVTVIPDVRVESDADQSSGFAWPYFSRPYKAKIDDLFDVVSYKWNALIISVDGVIHQNIVERVKAWWSTFDVNRIAITQYFGITLSVFIFYLIYVSIKVNNQRCKDPVQTIYEQFCKKVETIGVVRQSYESANDFMEKVSAQRPDLGEVGRKVCQLYNCLRYSKDPSGNKVSEFKKAVRAIKI